MVRLSISAVLAVLVVGTHSVRGQDTEEVVRLKEKVELLESKLKLAEKEIEDLRAGKAAKPIAAKPPAEPKVVATWAHQVGRDRDATRKTLKMYSNGKIDSPEGRATWHITGQLLTLKWPAPNAPGGAWEDVVILASDGKSYAGKNNKGTPIFGVKLAAGDIDEGKKK